MLRCKEAIVSARLFIVQTPIASNYVAHRPTSSGPLPRIFYFVIFTSFRAGEQPQRGLLN
jgi:hypothetical protein